MGSTLAFDLSHDLAGPGPGAPLGYAENGVNLLWALCDGALLSLSLALFCTLLSVVIGVAIGSIGGLFGGRLDNLLSQIIDIALAFPGILLAIYIGALLKPSLFNLVIALCATGWVPYARVVRAQVQSLKSRDFVMAAKALGAGYGRIIFKHLLPHTLGPVAVQAGFGFSGVIVAEAALSFLGIGVPVGTASWGALLDQGVTFLFVAPHIAFFTILFIFGTVLVCNLASEALRDALEGRPH